eukprot:TRINITY_DN2602_c0_g2_i2.p1 TRINITY_DN2602_c0_g2~~TRINITY_DN2602_c0_g2_i2.p1  ORF type:complete len:118 (-),score=28.01 TRINITY_DN2602_c0_g2_i2:164-517(-)
MKKLINFTQPLLKKVKDTLEKYPLIIKTPILLTTIQPRQPDDPLELNNQPDLVRSRERLNSLVKDFVEIRIENLFYRILMHNKMTALSNQDKSGKDFDRDRKTEGAEPECEHHCICG